MSGLVHRPIGPVGGDLVVLDATRRLYAGISRDGAYWHVVHPAATDLVNNDGEIVRREGELVCTCKGSAFRGRCYRVEQGEAFETANVSAFRGAPDLGFEAPGELMEAFGK